MKRAPAFVLYCAALACVPQSIFDEGGESSESESDSGAPPVNKPSFVDPADGSETLRADHRQALDLRVRGVQGMHTTLLIDGHAVGTLPDDEQAMQPGSLGVLTRERLKLNFYGALPAGVHALELFNPGESAGRISVPVAIAVQAVVSPTYSIELDPPSAEEAFDLWLEGHGQHARALWLKEGPAPRVAIAPIREEGDWDLDEAAIVTVPGYVPDATPNAAGRAAITTRVVDEGLHLAWLSGSASRELHYASYPDFPEQGPSAQSGLALSADAPIFASREWAAFGAPRFVGAQLLVPVHAPTNTEQANPGDHGMWSAGWLAGHAGPGAFASLGVAPGENLNHVGPLLDFLRPSTRDAVLVRVGDAWIRALGSHVNLPGLSLSDPTPTHGTPVALADTRFAGVAGALGSRTVLSLDSLGGARMLQEALFAERASTSFKAELLPALAPWGELAPGVVAGLPVFVIAYGPDTDLQLVSSNGNRIELTALSARCDRVIVSPTRVGMDYDESGTARLPLLCLSEGTLRSGRLLAQRP